MLKQYPEMKIYLENRNIRLRAPEPEDLDVLYVWENDTEMWESGSSIHPFSRFTLKQYLIDSRHDIYVDKQLRLIVELKESAEPAGAVDLYDFDPFNRRAGVGILIDKKFRKQGLGLQTLILLEEYAFGFLKLRQLYAFVPVKNKESTSLFTKAFYLPVGILKEWLSGEESFEDVQVMQKINPEK